MALDFTIKKYEELCELVSHKGIKTITVGEYLSSKIYDGNILLLRHDVDKSPESALRMATVEKKYNIVSSYYFRNKKGVFNPGIIESIAKLNHEIGYHYEVMDKAKGDFEKAIEIFIKELAEFRQIYDVKTIAMHGNPLSKWDNRDIWSKYNFKDYGITGEVYLSIDYSKVLYLSDTGRNWSKGKHKVKDYIPGGQVSLNIVSTDELIDFLPTSKQPVCLLAHPNRWSANWYDYIYQWAFDSMGNIVKSILNPVKADKKLS